MNNNKNRVSACQPKTSENKLKTQLSGKKYAHSCQLDKNNFYLQRKETESMLNWIR